MELSRSSGILLHPTSFPGRFGIGDLGPAAHEWIETLATTGTEYWQVLPLGPTGYGDSPYQCFSSFAGNPNLAPIYLPEGFIGHPLLKSYPLLAREVKPWPGTVDVEDMPSTDNPEGDSPGGDA